MISLATMPDNAATEIDKHEELWFEDGNLVLLVRHPPAYPRAVNHAYAG